MSATSGGQTVSQQPEVWVTGIGLVSSLGEGVGAHWAALAEGDDGPIVNEQSFAPYPVHALGEIDFSSQIERKSDLRQMGQWQRTGVFAAGLALKDANLAGNPDLLSETDLIVAAGNGERDETADAAVLRALDELGTCDAKAGSVLNGILQKSLRPTLYLGELSNLLAGNISITHGVAGSSRTYKGEEMAGVSAVEDAARRIGADQGQLFLVGGAFNSERADLSVVFELCRALWHGPFASVWERAGADGGFIMGSLGAFLVLESDKHARARGKRPYAKISHIRSESTGGPLRKDEASKGPYDLMGALTSELNGPVGLLSGASGVKPSTEDEQGWIEQLKNHGISSSIRAYGTMLGHSLEAHFPAGIALAALAVSKRKFYRPFDDTGYECVLPGELDRTLVTGWGHWRGKGLALVESAGKQ